MKHLALILVGLLLFSSCSFMPDTAGRELLRAPMMNQMQAQIHTALSQTLDPSQLVYKYPQSGEHRSPFVFYDIDGDGLEEALVFYSYGDTPEAVTVKLLRQDQGEWRSFVDIGGKGSQVDFLQFAPLVKQGQACLIIGWGSGEYGRQKQLSVYTMTSTGLKEELVQPYSSYQIGEYLGDGYNQLVLVQRVAQRLEMQLYGVSGSSLKQQQTLQLYEETTDVLQMLEGTLDNGTKALFIDEEMVGNSVSYGTEVVAIDESGLTVLVGGLKGRRPTTELASWEAFAQTFRLEKELSVDLDGNGQVEVPHIRAISEDSGSDGDTVSLIEYLNYVDGSFAVRHTAAVNKKAGYLLYFPQRWIGQVTIVRDPQGQVWELCKIDPTTGEASTMLFRVRMFYSKDYMDGFSRGDLLLDTRGLFSYYGYIPETTDEPLAITQTEAVDMFRLT